MKRHRGHQRRQYPRVARINELLREILAEALDRIDDDELVMVTITGVDCDADLRRAVVFFDGPEGAAGDDALAEALEAVRYRLQKAVSAQARIKHTPELRFAPDPAVRAGEHIDAVLRTVPEPTLDDEGRPLADGASDVGTASALGDVTDGGPSGDVPGAAADTASNAADDIDDDA